MTDDSMTRSKRKKVAVVGAGSSGLTAIKWCKEEDIDVVCFEKSENIGGLWRYHEDDQHGLASVMRTTVINTSKEITAFSDFPPPKDFANYMHHSQIYKYLCLYAETFGLYDHIRYNHEVISIVKAEDYEINGKWKLTIKNMIENQVFVEIFDGVMICIGHHVYPQMPKFPGLDQFKGKVVHSHSLKNGDDFKNLNALVIGIGNSGIDAAVEISNVAKQVYLCSRRGSWLTPKVGYKGLPFDAMYLTRFYFYTLKFFGWRLASIYAEKVILNKSKFDHSYYGLKPKHHFFSQHPAINDYLPAKILTGTVKITKYLKTFTPNGVIFDGDTTETPIDAVVLATGYVLKFPFLTEELLKVADNKVSLYKNVFPPDLKHPTLAVIGLIQPAGSIFPISELQSRWFALIMKEKTKLPSKEAMKEDIRRRRKYLESRFVSSPRHTIQVDHVLFMDEIAEQFGAKPKILKYLFADPALFWACFYGPCVAYQYRLEGPHAWPGARNTILTVPERVTGAMTGGPKKFQSYYFYDFWIFWSVILLVYILYKVFY